MIDHNHYLFERRFAPCKLFVSSFALQPETVDLDLTTPNRDQSTQLADGKTGYRGHENPYQMSNGHYLLTGTGRDVQSICYVRCVALHASRCNKYPSGWNTVAITHAVSRADFPHVSSPRRVFLSHWTIFSTRTKHWSIVILVSILFQAKFCFFRVENFLRFN